MLGNVKAVYCRFPEKLLEDEVYKKLLSAQNEGINIEVPQRFIDTEIAQDNKFKYTTFMKDQGFTLKQLLNSKESDIDQNIYKSLIEKSNLDTAAKNNLKMALDNGSLDQDFYDKIKSIVRGKHIEICTKLLDKGIALGDLHNENVLINYDGDVYVIDFDFVKLIDVREIEDKKSYLPHNIFY